MGMELGLMGTTITQYVMSPNRILLLLVSYMKEVDDWSSWYLSFPSSIVIG